MTIDEELARVEQMQTCPEWCMLGLGRDAADVLSAEDTPGRVQYAPNFGSITVAFDDNPRDAERAWMVQADELSAMTASPSALAALLRANAADLIPAASWLERIE